MRGERRGLHKTRHFRSQSIEEDLLRHGGELIVDKKHWVACLLLVLAAASATSSPGGAGTPDFSAFEGAWLEPGVPCARIYVWDGKGASFRKPLNIKISALIISPKQIATPRALCRIRSISGTGERRMLSMTCSTPLKFSPMEEVLSISADGVLHRHLAGSDVAETRYERCSP